MQHIARDEDRSKHYHSYCTNESIAREYYNLSEIDRQNDDEKTKAQKKKKFEKLRNHVRNTIEAYKKKQLKQTA